MKYEWATLLDHLPCLALSSSHDRQSCIQHSVVFLEILKGFVLFPFPIFYLPCCVSWSSYLELLIFLIFSWFIFLFSSFLQLIIFHCVLQILDFVIELWANVADRYVFCYRSTERLAGRGKFSRFSSYTGDILSILDAGVASDGVSSVLFSSL